jgi:amino acid permease
MRNIRDQRRPVLFLGSFFSSVIENREIENYICDCYNNTMKKFQIIIGSVVGIVCLGLAVVYWTMPAGSLPSWLPGFIAGSGIVHIKHGVAALIVAIAAFVLAWFGMGKKAA